MNDVSAGKNDVFTMKNKLKDNMEKHENKLAYSVKGLQFATSFSTQKKSFLNFSFLCLAGVIQISGGSNVHLGHNINIGKTESAQCQSNRPKEVPVKKETLQSKNIGFNLPVVTFTCF